MIASFIDPRLQADCAVLGRLGGELVLLHRTTLIPWFILVPPGDHTDLHQLGREQRIALYDGADAIARFILQRFTVTKINIAAIGNVVAQLHLHVIGRHHGDPCWPGVVWGRIPASPRRDDDDIAQIRGWLMADVGMSAL